MLGLSGQRIDSQAGRNLKEISMKTAQNLISVRTKVKHHAGALLVGFTVLALVVAGISPTARAQGDVFAPLEGSWIFAITRTQDLAASFTSLTSFTAGGILLASGSNDHVSSPLHGSWTRIGTNRFSSTAYFLAFDPANLNRPAVAMLRVNQVFQLKNRDELVGAGDLSRCDMQGQSCVNIPSGNIQTSAKRIVPENPKELSEMLPQ
jgi:hypothetical protein